jgi:hypothetical protein
VGVFSRLRNAVACFRSFYYSWDTKPAGHLKLAMT